MAFSNIPAELRALPQWVCWRYEPGPNGKPTKIPVSPVTGYAVSVADPTGWGTFQQAVARFVASATGQLDTGLVSGIGFVFSANDPYAGIDLDDANGNDAVLRAHNRIIAAFPSYTEISPSGKGLHIIVRGRIQGARRYGVEAYSDGRYFTFTGNVWRNLPIVDCQPMLTELQHELAPARTLHTLVSEQPQTETDEAIIQRMLSAKNGAKVRRLADGDASAIDGADKSGSAIDMALVNVIQYYTKNVEQIERIWLGTSFAGSAERAKKMKRLDYRLRTVRLAFDNTPPPVDLSALQAQWAGALPADAAAHLPHSGGPGAGMPTAQPEARGVVARQGGRVNPFQPPPGLLGTVAQCIYDGAARQVPEIALAGAIAWMAGVAGQAYNVNGLGLNVYLVVLASSGTGKEAISTGFTAIEDAVLRAGGMTVKNFIGPGNIASAPALLKHVARQRSSVSLVGEFGHWLSEMIGPRANPTRSAIKTALTDMFTKSGAKNTYRQTVYSDKENNIMEIRHPAYSLIGESVPSTFYRNVSDAVIEDGFMPRFIIIEYDGPAPYVNEQTQHYIVPDAVGAQLAQFVSRCETLNAPDKSPQQMRSLIVKTVGPIDVRIGADVAGDIAAFGKHCTDVANAAHNEGTKNVWSRVWANVMKLAGLAAVGVNQNIPTVGKVEYEWARGVVLHSVYSLIGKVESGEIASSEEIKQYADLKRCIRDLQNADPTKLGAYGLTPFMAKNGIINTLWLHRRVAMLASYKQDRQGSTVALKRVLQRAIEDDTLVMLPTDNPLVKQHQLRGTVYAVNKNNV